jgi:hypothetical protein
LRRSSPSCGARSNPWHKSSIFNSRPTRRVRSPAGS